MGNLNWTNMKINVNQIQTIPPHLQEGKFGFCVHGQPHDFIQSWIDFWELETQASDSFTNIYPDPHQNLAEYFEAPLRLQLFRRFQP